MIEVQNTLNELKAEGDILIALYEWPGVTISSHTLTQGLNPNLEITAPEYRTAFAHVSSIIEKHIGGLIRGKRSRDADGVFFNNLKLTSKGERAAIAAIQERKRRALPGILMEVVDRLRERERRAKG